MASCRNADAPYHDEQYLVTVDGETGFVAKAQVSKYKLDIVANALSLPDFQHHRASDDALTCGYLYLRFAKMLQERGLSDIQSINADMVTLRAARPRPLCSLSA